MASEKGRRHAEQKGRLAEWLSAAYLQLKGYRVLSRRFKARGGEIDLAVRRRDVVALVEVKARDDVGAAIDAVTPRARRRIEQAGRVFLSYHPTLQHCAWRYDIMVVAGWRLFHLKDAWREGD